VKKPSIMVGGFNDIYREVNMRELNLNETEAVSGGFSFFGITNIPSGIVFLGQVAAVAYFAEASYNAGHAIGTAIYNGYEYMMGDNLGGDIYDFWNC
jgi:hypothetical protein